MAEEAFMGGETGARQATSAALAREVPAYLDFLDALAAAEPDDYEAFESFRQATHTRGSDLLGLSLRAMRQLEETPDPGFHRLVELLRDITESLLAAGSATSLKKMRSLPLVSAAKVRDESTSLGLR